MIQSCFKAIPKTTNRQQRALIMDNLHLWASTLTLPAQAIERRRAYNVGTVHCQLRLHSEAIYKQLNINRHFADNLPLTGPYLFGRTVTRVLKRMADTFAFGHGKVYRRYLEPLRHPDVRGAHMPIWQREIWCRPTHIQRQIQTRGLLLAAPWASMAVNMPAQETCMEPHVDDHNAEWGLCTIASAGHYTGGKLIIHPADIQIATRPVIDTVSFPSAKLIHSNTQATVYRMSMIGSTSSNILGHLATLPALDDYPQWPAHFWQD
ncbi:hypothetical protein CBOM_01922 [Ceraceosorus bombacis]|uniref:Uncharacterized protein n=1 Tax=Ceraceosorus bombacis TaxID=401625 RepID=A0A0P1BEJ6_9BASI|nr:hypothetical protein CBOM_01922 [Ceraceosorus bombacis]